MLRDIFNLSFLISTLKSQIVNINIGQNGNEFTPYSVTATAGNRIVFTWFTGIHNVIQMNDNSCTNVTSGGITSGLPTNHFGKTFNFTVTEPGNFWYACQVHCASGMKGLIVVENNSSVPTTMPTATALRYPSFGVPTEYPTKEPNKVIERAPLPIWLLLYLGSQFVTVTLLVIAM